MANINMEELEKNAQELNEVLNETNELLDSINNQKQDILATDTQIHRSEIDIRNTLRGQNKELDTQDTSLEVILDSLKEEIAKLERIYSLYEQIGTQIGDVNRGTKKAEEFEESRLAKLNEIKRAYDEIKESIRATAESKVKIEVESATTSSDDSTVVDSPALISAINALNTSINALTSAVTNNTPSASGSTSSKKTDDDKEGLNKSSWWRQLGSSGLSATLKISGDIFKKWVDIDQKVFEFGRNAGLAVDQMRAVQKNVLESYGQMAARLGMTYEEIFKFQEQYVQNTGRAVLMTNDQVESLASMSKLVGESAVNNAVQNMDDLGASTSTASDYLALTMARARTQGLDAKKASETFASNIKMASRYSFREGVNGVSKMALLSQQLKFNMESIGATIEKFSTIEGAIETSANIQMLGGAYAANFANPLDAMGEALLDAESFINRIVNTVSSQATFNRETGQVEMAAFEKARLREFAKQMGINYDEAWNMVAQQTKIQNIQRDIPLANYTEEEKALIANKAQYDTREGRWEVTLPGEKEGTAITALTDSMISQLRDNAAPQEAMQRDVHEMHDDLRRYITYSMTTSRSLREQIRGAQENVLVQGANYMSDPILQPIKTTTGQMTREGGFWGSAAIMGALGVGSVVKGLGIDWIGRGIKGGKGGAKGGSPSAPTGQGYLGKPKQTIYKGRRAWGMGHKALGTKLMGKGLSAGAGKLLGPLAIGLEAISLVNNGAEYKSNIESINSNQQMSEKEKANARYEAKKERNRSRTSSLVNIGLGALALTGPIGAVAALGLGVANGVFGWSDKASDSLTKKNGAVGSGVESKETDVYGQVDENHFDTQKIDYLASIDKHVGQITSGSIRQPSVIPHTTVGNYTAINTSSTSNAYSNGKMSIEPINLNLNGSIKLTSDKGVSKDIDINALLGNTEFMTRLKEELVKMIGKQIGQGRANNNTVPHLKNEIPSLGETHLV